MAGEGEEADGKKKSSKGGPSADVSRKTEYGKIEYDVEHERTKEASQTTRKLSYDDKKQETTKKLKLYKKEWIEDKKGYVLDHEGKGNTAHSEGSSSVGLLHYSAGAKSDLTVDWNKQEAKLNVISIEAKGSIVHGEAEGSFDLGGWFNDLMGSGPTAGAVPHVTPSAGGGPLAARVTDLTSHGSPLVPGIGSVNVLIGGLPAWRAMMDMHTCPIVKGVVPDVGGVVLVGSPTVLINNMMACRVGDFVTEIPGGPNAIVLGCTTVMIGVAGSGAPGAPAIASPEDAAKLAAKGNLSGDVGIVEVEASAGATFDMQKEVSAKAKAGALIAAAKGSAEGQLTIPLWGSHAITLGGSAEGSLLSAGAEGEASASWKAGEGAKLKLGGKIGAGIAGVGLGFSLGVK